MYNYCVHTSVILWNIILPITITAADTTQLCTMQKICICNETDCTAIIWFERSVYYIADQNFYSYARSLKTTIKPHETCKLYAYRPDVLFYKKKYKENISQSTQPIHETTVRAVYADPIIIIQSEFIDNDKIVGKITQDIDPNFGVTILTLKMHINNSDS